MNTDLRTVLATSTDDNGITTTTYVGRVQSDPSPDGTAVLTVFPVSVKTIGDTVITETNIGYTPGFAVNLTAQQYGAVSALIKAQWDADHA